MKIKNGFVSNSSSSSFVCDVCGYEICGRDISVSDYDMSKCEKGHIFCHEHRAECDNILDLDNIKNESDLRLIRQIVIDYCSEKSYYADDLEKAKICDDEEIVEMLNECYYEQEVVPSACCPLCMFNYLSDCDMINYVIKSTGKSRKDFLKEIKKKYSSYKEFEKDIDKGKNKSS